MSYKTKDGTVIPLDLPEGEKKHFIQPCFVKACRGNERIANILGYFVVGGSKERAEGCNVVKIIRTHKQILSTLQPCPSRKSLIRYLDQLTSWGLVLSEPYQREFTIDVEALQ